MFDALEGRYKVEGEEVGCDAQGRKIYIGKRDDGTVIGVSNSKRLLEDIPNKIQNKLGIVADVNLLTENGLEYIEIVVNP